MEDHEITLDINDKTYKFGTGPDAPRLRVIRDHLQLTGTKFGCGIGTCVTCTVQINGEAVRPCQISSQDVQGKMITTIEGLPGNLHVKLFLIGDDLQPCGSQQSNFDDYEVLRIDEMPEITVHIMDSKQPPGGVGEPGVSPTAPAVANAVFAVSGVRIHTLPMIPDAVRK